MSLTHAKVSAKSDGGDATLVRPSDWNADHVLGRLKISAGTALVAGDFALSSGWGNTATVTAVLGYDNAWEILVTCQGTGIASSPTITLTFHDGTWTLSPIAISKMVGGTGAFSDLTDATTATTLVMTYNGLPVSGLTYRIRGLLIGR
jgi:hypothetical protein